MQETGFAQLWKRPLSLDARAWSLVLLGASGLLACVHWIGGRPFWLDEAMVALNLEHLTAAELAGPLEYDQIAPIGWLQLHKVLLGLPVSAELSMRAPSLLAWIGALVLVRDICFRSFGAASALAGFALFAFAAGGLRYAVELKPYGLDVFFAAASIWVAVRLMAPGRANGSAALTWSLFALVGLSAAIFSFAGTLAFAASGSAVLLHQANARRWVDFTTAVAVCAACAGFFLALYLEVYRHQVAGTSLVTGGAAEFFQASYYAPLEPTPGAARWYIEWWFGFVAFLYGEVSRGLMAVLLAVGVVLLPLRRPWLALAAIGPLAFGLLVSSTETYPMYDRLALFTLPGLVIAASALFERILEAGAGGRMATGVLLAGGLAGSAADIAGHTAMQPPYVRQDLRQVLATLDAQRRPDDRLYVHRFTLPTFLWGATHDGPTALSRIEGATPSDSWVCMISDLPDLAAGQRVWLLTSEVADSASDRDIATALAALGVAADVTQSSATRDVFLYRLDIQAVHPSQLGADSAASCAPAEGDAPMQTSPRLRSRISSGPADSSQLEPIARPPG